MATYVSAAAEAESLGNRYALLIFDEVHHLPAGYTRVIAEYSIAPYRLGLTATPERADGRDRDLEGLVGPVVYSRTPGELAGGALAPFRGGADSGEFIGGGAEEVRGVCGAAEPRFCGSGRFSSGSLEGWRRFVRASAGSPAGRAAMLAHRESKRLASGTEEKFRVLEELLARHRRAADADLHRRHGSRFTGWPRSSSCPPSRTRRR